MRKFIISAVLFVVALVTFTSCFNSDNSYTYYDDAAITAFSVGTLKRFVHTTTSDGRDSVYQTTASCSGYTFNIDQASHEIWNADSLPIGIDSSRVVCTISTKNSGVVAIKSMISDSIFNYSSTDSVNMSEPRYFYVYNSNGTAYTIYKVTVNIHREKADTCIWTKVDSTTQIASLSGMKAFALNDNIYLFGKSGSYPKVYTTAQTDGHSWKQLTTNPDLSTEAYKNIVIKNGEFYCLSEQILYKSVDAANWQEIASCPVLKQLVAATTMHLYAISNSGKMLSSADNGQTWAEEELDEKESLLPTDEITYSCRALQTNYQADKVVLIGNSPQNTNHAVVWTKIDEYSEGARNHAWSYATQAANNSHKAPHAKSWAVVSYDYPDFKAICGDGISPDTTKALSQVYQCGDDGITWLKDSVITVPSGLKVTNGSVAMTVDKDNSVWVFCGGTGQIWKFRINRLAWKKEQEYFE